MRFSATLLMALLIAPPSYGNFFERCGGWGDSWRIYETDGLGKIQTCEDISCSYEEVEILYEIDQVRDETEIYHEEKNGGKTMCYMQLECGIWIKEMMMFECTPVREK